MRTATAIALSFAGWLSTASGATAAEAFRLEILWSAPIVTDPSRQPAGITTAGLILNAQNVSPDERTVLLAGQVTSGKRSQVLLTDIERKRPDAAVTLTQKGALPAGEGLFSRMFNGPHPSALCLHAGGRNVGRCVGRWIQ